MILNFTRVETHQHLTTTSTIHMRRRTLKGKRVRKNSREVLLLLNEDFIKPLWSFSPAYERCHISVKISFAIEHLFTSIMHDRVMKTCT
jgi:hypothetical protein